MFVNLSFLSRDLRRTTNVIVDRALYVASSKLGCELIRVPVPTVSLYDGIIGKAKGEEDHQVWFAVRKRQHKVGRGAH